MDETGRLFRRTSRRAELHSKPSETVTQAASLHPRTGHRSDSQMSRRHGPSPSLAVRMVPLALV
jgi:hypothetical protein